MDMNTDALNRIRGSLLKHSLWLLLANTTLGLLLVPVTISSLPAYIYVGAFLPFYLVLFLSMWLLGRGSREAAAWTLVGGIFILQGFANVFNPGAAEQAMASFINLILLAGVTLNRRAGLVTAGMALSGMVVYLVMFDLGMLPEPFISLTLLERIPIIGLTVLTTGGLVAIAVTHVAWAFNGEQQARRQAQASSESLSLALAENHLRARLSNDLVGMSQRLLTSHETMDQLGTLAETLIAVDGLHAVALFRADGVQLVERGWQDARRSDAAEIAVTLDGLHNAHTMRLRGVPELLHSEAAGDFYRAAAGLLSTAEARLEAEQRLQRANQLQAVGRLAAGIAHDFNNLLVSIQGGLEL
ncbi:MAG: hypothetical protein VX000_07575, partial [Myxococcota bacterium]|nr:hypothetical protein [Myxococcota bacterium]